MNSAVDCRHPFTHTTIHKLMLKGEMVKPAPVATRRGFKRGLVVLGRNGAPALALVEDYHFHKAGSERRYLVERVY